jgi:hypothetical protein
MFAKLRNTMDLGFLTVFLWAQLVLSIIKAEFASLRLEHLERRCELARRVNDDATEKLSTAIANLVTVLRDEGVSRRDMVENVVELMPPEERNTQQRFKLVMLVKSVVDREFGPA